MKYLLALFLVSCQSHDPFEKAVRDVWRKLPDSQPEYFKNHKCLNLQVHSSQ